MTKFCHGCCHGFHEFYVLNFGLHFHHFQLAFLRVTSFSIPFLMLIHWFCSPRSNLLSIQYVSGTEATVLVLETQLQMLSHRNGMCYRKQKTCSDSSCECCSLDGKSLFPVWKAVFPPANTMSCSTWPENYLSQGLKAADAFACKLRNLQPCGSWHRTGWSKT